MADYPIHIAQAEHNEEAAKKLAFDPPYHDWGITAAFYSAIHYFESWLFYKGERHTETSIPSDEEGKLKFTAHGWREKIIVNKLTRAGFKAFRKLRDSSETARYLSLARLGTKSIEWLDRPASQYFKPQHAQKMVEKDLQTLKKELKIDLSKLLHSLKLQNKTPNALLIIQQILSRFHSKESFLNASLNNLKRFMSEDTLSLLRNQLEQSKESVKWK
ncbi:MAG: hypothetical protein DRP15_03015 [Candidatus Aenigmatarchaeota archaeon]|nr:hypothetical protein [Deltaproteobacteria bacterium]MBW2106363.1 hypothetical protein [Deltaproteobacteria bacterium]RLJ09638.1 MAG: hypothetical protein DRP15_03015 [Candidatus Aenigmarchaeota archaeon]